jgi:threonylcarbamoyladenosine tRNA methylthiotransferase MtaB
MPLLTRFPGHQRAFVKVQDGCDAFCAYCVVPYTRPIVQWRPPELVEQECRNLLRAGHKELVLCGVFLGAYGRLTARRRRWGGESSLLPDLVRRIGSLPGLWRLRLSSLEPGDLTDGLLDAFRATPAAAWHFHLPLQSGSGRILRRMNRQYAPEDFRRAVGRIRSACPDAAITTDILVGFPGETDGDFGLTLEMARHAEFSKIHAFAFSAIQGTAAWTYRREAPPPAVVRARLSELADSERELAVAYRTQFVGRTMEALVESPSGVPRSSALPRCHGPTSSEDRADEEGAPELESARSRRGGAVAPQLPTGRRGQAMTDRYLIMYFRDAGPQPGQVATFRVTGVHPDGLAGRLAARAET